MRGFRVRGQTFAGSCVWSLLATRNTCMTYFVENIRQTAVSRNIWNTVGIAHVCSVTQISLCRGFKQVSTTSFFDFPSATRMITASQQSLNNLQNKQVHRVATALQTSFRHVPSSISDADFHYFHQLPQRNNRNVPQAYWIFNFYLFIHEYLPAVMSETSH